MYIIRKKVLNNSAFFQKFKKSRSVSYIYNYKTQFYIEFYPLLSGLIFDTSLVGFFFLLSQYTPFSLQSVVWMIHGSVVKSILNFLYFPYVSHSIFPRSFDTSANVSNI